MAIGWTANTILLIDKKQLMIYTNKVADLAINFLQPMSLIETDE